MAIGPLDSIDNNWVLGPQHIISVPRAETTLAMPLAAAFAHDSGSVSAATFPVHLVRERGQTLGGRLRTRTREQGGFSLHVWLPQLVGTS
jgi:hypothetical protein